MNSYLIKKVDDIVVSNYHFNSEYYMQVSQFATGDSRSINPRERTFTRGYRNFYIKDGETVWCPTFRPLSTISDSFECQYNLESTRIISSKNNLQSVITVFVPLEGDFEVWEHSITNHTNSVKNISVFPAMSLEYGDMGAKCVCDKSIRTIYSRVYPYHIKYAEWEGVAKQNNYCYFHSDKEFDSCDMGERHFYNSDFIDVVPQAVKQNGCSNKISEQDKPIAAFCYKITLKPNETIKYHLFGGTAHDIDAINKRVDIFKSFDFDSELAKSKDYFNSLCDTIQISTPDKGFDDYVNFWCKKQLALMNVTQRMSKGSCVRNQLQDALGYGILSKNAEKYFLDVIKLQLPNGRLPQHHVIDNAYPLSGLGLLTMTDGTSWLVNCVAMYILEVAAYDFLDVNVKYADGTNSTVKEHLLRGCEYMWQDRGMHGLSLLGDGDWTDPINGPGRNGKGVSTWTSMATVFAYRNLTRVLEHFNPINDNISLLCNRANELDELINKVCYMDNQYIGGFNDDGVPYGCQLEKEGKIFLNMHSWGIISGVAKGDRIERCKEIFLELDTPVGPKVMSPSFTKWDALTGKVSVKLAGTNENGSIYCHAAMFKIWANYCVGDGDNAYDSLSKLLSTNPNNPPKQSLQSPLFVPNQYFGEEGPNFGRSSRVVNTGTPAWYLYNVVYGMFGIKFEANSIKSIPCMPTKWNNASIILKYKNAVYNINVLNGKASINVNSEVN